jgi:superfamily II DNA or RNA helicase
VTAATIRDLVSRFNAKYRLGTSATTDRQNGKFEFALNVLGEVFYQEDEEALRDAGMLMRPTVKVIRTNFNYIYWNDHNSDDEDKCEVPGCPMSGKRPHAHRNNYTQLKQTLVADEDRNRIVINTMLREALKGRHHHLIVSDEVKHLQALEAVLIEETTAALRAIPPVYTLIGKVTGKKRAEMKTEIENAPEAIVFATVAKEGLDIPAIDRIYLPFPSGNGKKVQQWIGRGTRIAEDKTEIVVFDFFDINVGVLKAQFRKRRTGCYYPLGMEIDLG